MQEIVECWRTHCKAITESGRERAMMWCSDTRQKTFFLTFSIPMHIHLTWSQRLRMQTKTGPTPGSVRVCTYMCAHILFVYSNTNYFRFGSSIFDSHPKHGQVLMATHTCIPQAISSESPGTCWITSQIWSGKNDQSSLKTYSERERVCERELRNMSITPLTPCLLFIPLISLHICPTQHTHTHYSHLGYN